jgi:uncharacterized protein (DUF1684 family)
MRQKGYERVWLTLLVLLAALPGTGCKSPESAVMLHLSTPPNWQESMEILRAQKDEYFRRGTETPLPADRVAGFEGLEYWDPDPAFYFVGHMQVYTRPEKFDIGTTAGGQRPCERYGQLTFPIGGEMRTLQVYRMLDDPPGEDESFLLPFRDETSGKETYPSGRYVNLDGPPGGPYVLDFNVAYNPSCAYGDVQRFACPVTPSENRLSIRIEAGERGYQSDDG